MTARVTDVQHTNNFIEQIFYQRGEMNRVQAELSSGIRVAKASDDPGRASTISEFQSTIQRLQRHQDRANSASSILEAQGTVLNTTQDILLRAKELAVSAANGTVPDEVRLAMSREIFQLRDQLVGVVNSRIQGSYIYGGALDDVYPYYADATTVYDVPPLPPVPPALPGPLSEIEEESQVRYVFIGEPGDVQPGWDITRNIQITDSDAVRLTSDGEVYINAITALEYLGRSLAGYRTELQDQNSSVPPAPPVVPNTSYDLTGLNVGDSYTTTGANTIMYVDIADGYAVQTNDILTAVNMIENASVNNIEVERTSVGSRLTRISNAHDMLNLLVLDTQKAQSAIQDADIFAAAARFSSMEVSLQALLSSGSRISSLSLLNFI